MRAALPVLLPVLAMTPQQKAAMLVVTTARAGVFSGAAGITFGDQEGGVMRALRDAPPWRSARSYGRAADAFAAARQTVRALRSADVDVDFAPVLDAPDGPLCSRQFARA